MSAHTLQVLKELETRQHDLLAKRKSVMKNLEEVHREASHLGQILLQKLLNLEHYRLKKHRNYNRKNPIDNKIDESASRIDESQFFQAKKRKFNNDREEDNNTHSAGVM